jgi:retron-type reverse transcriptase
MTLDKPLPITKRMVWEAYQLVARNGKAAGVDGQSLDEFAQDLGNNLYKLWNRMASGSYFPPAVKRVEIPKANGGIRPLGIPTVAVRIARMVVKQWNRGSIECSTPTRMAIGLENPRIRRSSKRASDAGTMTGLWTSTSKAFSTRSIMPY